MKVKQRALMIGKQYVIVQEKINYSNNSKSDKLKKNCLFVSKVDRICY